VKGLNLALEIDFFFAHAIKSISYQAALTLNKRFWLVYEVPHEQPNIHKSEYHSDMATLLPKALLQYKRMKKCQQLS